MPSIEYSFSGRVAMSSFRCLTLSLYICGTVRVEEPNDPCWQYGAEMMMTRDCRCPVGRFQVPSEECGASGKNFRPQTAQAGCKCFSPHAAAMARRIPVKISAVSFCSAVLQQMSHPSTMKKFVQRIKEKVLANPSYEPMEPTVFEELKRKEAGRIVQEDLHISSEVCREVLTGTFFESESSWFSVSSWSSWLWKSFSWLADAAHLSKHAEAHGLGRLDPLLEGQSHHQLLAHVCQDECESIVNETMHDMPDMLEKDVFKGGMRFENSCADRVVRKVEAEMLGCCGRACGWNNQSCMGWPFFTTEQKVEWLEECCTEFNVLEGSSRERMCNSVLTPEQVKRLSEYNTVAREGTDVAGPYTGQDRPLLWTQKGISEFLLNVKVNSQVSSDFLERHPKIRREGLDKKWFKEEKLDDVAPSSLVEVDGCNLIGMHQCTPITKVLKMQSCHAGMLWEHSRKPDEDDFTTSCKSQTGTPVVTPDDCLLKDFPEAGNIIRRFFEYKNEARLTSESVSGLVPKHPIICHIESDLFPCEGDFGRTPLSLNDIREVVDAPNGFDDYLYWINENKAKERREQLKAKP